LEIYWENSKVGWFQPAQVSRSYFDLWRKKNRKRVKGKPTKLAQKKKHFSPKKFLLKKKS
jgi:hypothetical protein